MSTKVWAASFLDPALDYLKANANKICLCSAEPTTYLGATDTVFLAGATLASGDFSGPDDGFNSGRKLMIAKKEGVTVTATGTSVFFALVNTSTLDLLYVGRCPSTSMTISSTITIDPVSIEILDAF